MKEVNGKRMFILINAAVQAVFAMAFMCHKDPSIHWCAIAPMLACGGFITLCVNNDED